MHLTPAGVAHACGVRGAFRLFGGCQNKVVVSLRENARHNSSNVRGVTTGKVGRNSSKTVIYNEMSGLTN